MLNNIILIGRLTKDPELRYTPNGAAVATFTLAVERPFQNQSGCGKRPLSGLAEGERAGCSC